MNNIVDAQLEAAKRLRDRVEGMMGNVAGVTQNPVKFTGETGFAPPVACVCNPLTYAWPAFEEYVVRYGGTKKRVLFLGMNPGPWGMAQTGVPFGEIFVVRNWLEISAPIGRPDREHPKYPIDGYACKRSEVSGRRLWGLFMRRFETPEAFFREHFVANYCPLLFIAALNSANGTEGARNLTPDRLTASERSRLYDACDEHLCALTEALQPEFVVGVGNFAAVRAEDALRRSAAATDRASQNGKAIRIGKILHPSPASPQSQVDWAGQATRQLQAQGIW
ncbi:MAG: hypothetical protein LBT65_00540 [Synergistaceae bacterium]|jgi:single-strand selective monofunctional uracil DNA glycosylase|nr:hypothetical protein [Synergistaceae bacterium]